MLEQQHFYTHHYDSSVFIYNYYTCHFDTFTPKPPFGTCFHNDGEKMTIGKYTYLHRISGE